MILFCLLLGVAASGILVDGLGRNEEVIGAGRFVLLLVCEVLVGAGYGLPWALVGRVIPSCGRIIDVLRGVQFAEQLYPGSPERASALEGGLGVLLPVIFFSSFVWQSIFFGLTVIPAAVVRLPTIQLIGKDGGSYFLKLVMLTGQGFVGALLLVSPVIVIVLVVDWTMALLTRFVQPLGLSFELIPAKALICLLVFLFIPTGHISGWWKICEQCSRLAGALVG